MAPTPRSLEAIGSGQLQAAESAGTPMKSSPAAGSVGDPIPAVPTISTTALKQAPGTELDDLPAFCAAAAMDDTLQAAVLLANEQAMVVDLECKPAVYDQLPAAMRESAVPLVPLLFS